MSKLKILFKMTGSIACYKACNVLSKLTQEGHEVRVVASISALKFVGAATIEGLTGIAPVSDMYAPHNVMDHIHLMRWADLIVAAPATANFINKAAAGVGDDFLTTLFLAHDFKKPYLIAPAMNTSMYDHPVTQQSLKKLVEMGIQLVDTASGMLACGEVGKGRLAEPEMIIKAIHEHAKTTPASGKDLEKTKAIKVLITSGGTSEPIDDVRFITNKSTGRTGAQLADAFTQLGFETTYLHAENAILPEWQCNKDSFVSFDDLYKKMQKLSTSADIIIHCAAVSDFSLASPFQGKMSSDQDFVLKLKTNPKIINEIKKWNNKALLVGFKLTSTQQKADHYKAVQKLSQNSQADLVVHNDTHEMQGSQHTFHIYEKEKEIHSAQNTQELSQYLTSYIWNHTVERKSL